MNDLLFNLLAQKFCALFFTEFIYFQNMINNLKSQNTIKQINKITAKVTLLFSFLLSEEKVSLKK